MQRAFRAVLFQPFSFCSAPRQYCAPQCYKVPLLLVGIALVVDVIKRSGARDEVGGIVVDIQSGRVQQVGTWRAPAQASPGPSAVPLRAAPRPSVRRCTPSGCRSCWDIRRQQPRHGDAELPQRFIVAQLGLQLVAEGVVFAGASWWICFKTYCEAPSVTR